MELWKFNGAHYIAIYVSNLDDSGHLNVHMFCTSPDSLKLDKDIPQSEHYLLR